MVREVGNQFFVDLKPAKLFVSKNGYVDATEEEMFDLEMHHQQKRFHVELDLLILKLN